MRTSYKDEASLLARDGAAYPPLNWLRDAGLVTSQWRRVA